MKRSGLITGVTTMQLLMALLLFGLCVYLLLLTRSPKTRQAHDPAAAVWGLEVAFAVIAPFASLALVGAYGMWRGRLWGWWLALLAEAIFVAVLVYSVIDDGWNNADTDLIFSTAVSLLPVVLLLLPPVRRLYGAVSRLQPPVTAARPSI
jgi:hypothetical protein